MHAFTCIWWVCVWMCERSAGAGQVSGLGWEVCVASPVCPRLSQCGVMSALSLFSRQGSYWKHTLLLRQPISSVTHRAEPAQQCVSAETVSWLIQSLKNLKIISWLFYVKHSPHLWEFPTLDILYHCKWIICWLDETSNPIANMLKLYVSLNFTFMLWQHGA